VREGDVVVTMGAPPISLMGEALLAKLADMPADDNDRERAPRHAARDEDHI
jgi:UDP-N-acetylmuramate--alanine ligase